MRIKKNYHKKIEEGFKDIFNTDTKMASQNGLNNNFDGLITIVSEPLVRHQVIQLAKLCEEVPLNVTLKSSGNRLYIEFW